MPRYSSSNASDIIDSGIRPLKKKNKKKKTGGSFEIVGIFGTTIDNHYRRFTGFPGDSNETNNSRFYLFDLVVTTQESAVFRRD